MRAAQASSRRVLRTSSTVSGLAGVDCRGRVADHTVNTALGCYLALAWALAEINETAATTGNDPALDSLLLRLHTDTACRRGGALALRPQDLDPDQCPMAALSPPG